MQSTLHEHSPASLRLRTREIDRPIEYTHIRPCRMCQPQVELWKPFTLASIPTKIAQLYPGRQKHPGLDWFARI